MPHHLFLSFPNLRRMRSLKSTNKLSADDDHHPMASKQGALPQPVATPNCLRTPLSRIPEGPNLFTTERIFASPPPAHLNTGSRSATARTTTRATVSCS